ncbi:MAG: efflux RND transporter permease subunit [Methylococcales bacterium]|nr:efflux RND transporter permease subunit [Methylococcales bacterium]
MVKESDSSHFIGKVIAFCSVHALATLIIIFALSFWGYQSLLKTPIDATPDLSDVQVIVFTEWPGRSPDLIEDQITYPLTSSLLSVPHVKFVRGQSFMGASFIYVVFDEQTDMYWARSRVMEFITTAAKNLPDGADPILGPDATGVGWVFQYALIDKTGNHNLADLRSFQNFKLRPWLESVPGVAEVASIGGFEKEYQITVDPNKLASYGVTLKQIAKAVRRSNNDVGGRVLEIADHEHFIRGRGYIKSIADIKQIVLKSNQKGIPLLLDNVAKVSLGPAMRRGIAELDGEGEAVGGIVVMRYGEDAMKVIQGVKQRIENIRQSLPDGIEIVTTYDRSTLISQAIDTLKTTLFEEFIVVSLVILLFLRQCRITIIAVITLPVAILLAFIPLQHHGITANIMSLGGIAVAIGAMVDASIVMLDNIHRRLSQKTDQSQIEVVIKAMQEVGPSIFFSLAIITLSFLPVFVFEGTEGRLFRPLAYTKTYAMGFAALLAITLTPALATMLIRKEKSPSKDRLIRKIYTMYQPIVLFALHHRKPILFTALLTLVLTIPVFKQLETEFMPPLNEGTILYMPSSPPGMSITAAGNTLQAMNTQLKQFPEVEHVFGKIGRSTSSTDSAPLSMVETIISLKPKEQWREGLSWDDLIEEMDQTLDFPGMPNVWWMPIQTRTEMLATGIRSTLGIKVLGDNIETLEKVAIELEKILQRDERTKPFTRSAFAERLTGGYYLDFDINREKIARYGLTIADVEETIRSAVGGEKITQVISGRERYTINLRYAREFRDSPELLKQILVDTPSGSPVPISQLAELNFNKGPPMLRNENGELVSFVFIDIKDIGIGDYVELAQTVITEKVQIPAGFRISWAGQFKYLQRAQEKLELMVPLTLSIIFLLLYFNHNSIIAAIIILCTIPFALTGAIWLLYILDYKLSIAVWVGLIALAGLVAEMGVLMMLYLRIHCDECTKEHLHNNLEDVISRAAALRIRPMLMTSLTLLLGFIPILWSDGTGADVMKRIAAPMVGGVFTALLMILIVFPVIFSYWKEWEENKANEKI